MAGFSPNSGNRRLKVPQTFDLTFRPGGDDPAYIFNDFMELREYISRRPNQMFVLLVDFRLIDWTLGFDVPADMFSLERIEFRGVSLPDASRPTFNLPEGFTIDPDDQNLSLYNIDVVCRNTSTPIITPTTRYRCDLDLCHIIAEGSSYFADMSNGGDFVMSANRNAGFLNNGGSELLFVPAGTSSRIFLEADSHIGQDTLESEDATAIQNIFFEGRSSLETQANVPAAALVKSAFVKSGSTFPSETYPGKVFHYTGDDLIYHRNSADTAWVALEEKAEFLESPGITVNGVGGTFVTKITGNLNFISGDVYEIAVSYIWGTNPDKTPFRSRLFINGVAQGITTVVPNTFIHYDEVVKATDVIELVPGAGTSYQKPYTHIYRYTATATGSLPVILDFGTTLNTGYMARALIRSRRLPA